MVYRTHDACRVCLNKVVCVDLNVMVTLKTGIVYQNVCIDKQSHKPRDRETVNKTYKQTTSHDVSFE